MIFSFSTIKTVFTNLGFKIIDQDPVMHLFAFEHPTVQREVLIGLDNELSEKYMKKKMDEIQLPFEYFISLTTSMRN